MEVQPKHQGNLHSVVKYAFLMLSFSRNNIKFKKLTLKLINGILDLARPMIKKLAFTTTWFLATPLLLLIAILLLYTNTKSPQTMYAKLPLVVNELGERHMDQQVLGVKIDDNRPFIVERFLNGTPLEPYSEQIVEISDKYQLDYRLIPAIAMKESSAGNAAPSQSYNAWGFENGRTKFSSWEEAIETVGKTIKTKYADKGLITPEQMMPIYAPPQILTGGKWARDINHFFSQMNSL